MGLIDAGSVIGERGVLLAALGVMLGIAVVTDIRSQRIPNWLTFPSVIAGLLVHALYAGFRGFLFSISGVAVGLAVLVIPYLLGGLGAGDAKLMGAVGGFLGPSCVFFSFLFTALFGGAYALIILGFQGNIKKTMSRYLAMIKLLFLRTPLYLPPEEQEQGPKIRYGVAIAAGTVFSLLFTERIFPVSGCLTF